MIRVEQLYGNIQTIKWLQKQLFIQIYSLNTGFNKIKNLNKILNLIFQCLNHFLKEKGWVKIINDIYI